MAGSWDCPDDGKAMKFLFNELGFGDDALRDALREILAERRII